MSYVVHHGDCREVMATIDAESVDAVVCDPPYGLSFMGKGWDHGVPGEEFWTEALRVAKPGAHLLAFGGTRTYHRLACAIEDAGWEIRDCVMWVYSSGFPKSHDVSKAIDKAAGAERERIRGVRSAVVGATYAGDEWSREFKDSVLSSDPITAAARQWSGWGTALKPAWEPIIVARKPLVGTVAENVLTHGTGGINVDGCRVGTESTLTVRNGNSGSHGRYGKNDRVFTRENPPGRWPANLIHDGSEEVVGLFPQVKTGNVKPYKAATQSEYRQLHCSHVTGSHTGDSGSAARFFYCAKASKADRDEGCERFYGRFAPTMGNGIGGKEHDPDTATPKRNHHPTVKPTALMRYLCRLVTPPGGVVLDPFTGSGSTGKAAVCEGFDFVGIEREAEYVEIARARIAAAVLPLEAIA
jgi:site-specific DNA-methyltransferase (adenine-specific)